VITVPPGDATAGSELCRVVAGGVSMAVRVEGDPDGVPTVLLHGGGLTADTWRYVVQGLVRDHRCVVPELRGHGDSGWAPDGDYSLSTMARDLAALIDDLGLARPHLVGMSLGGQVALRAVCDGLAARSLALVDVGPRLRERSGADRVFLRTHRYPDFEAALEAAAAYRPGRSRTSLAGALRRGMLQNADGSWCWKWDPRRHETAAKRRAEAAALFDALSAVVCPALVVLGGASTVLGEALARELVAALPDARLAVVPGAGHAVQTDRPDELVARLAEFHRGVAA
jgi:pimeloyl-ACP methyl ester carboxylesterase